MAPSDLLSLIVTAPSYQAPLALMIGLVGLAYGGNLLVPATLSLAKQLHISPALVAVIVLAGGTSMPELLVSVQAAFQDSPAIALGNVVGSNLANSWLVLGLGGLIAPILIAGGQIKRDALVMVLLTALVIIGLVPLGGLGVGMALIMLAILTAYLIVSIRADEVDTEEEEMLEGGLARASVMTALSLICLVAGAELIVSGGQGLARQAGISEGVIGLTIIAIGTSLPEIAAVIASQLRGRSDIALGNVLGSNIFNIGMILGVTGLISPLTLGDGVTLTSLGFLAASALLLAGLVARKAPMQKAISLGFLGLYVIFIWHQI